jgi:DNA-binding CsgD family transcriptional regulator
MTLAELRAAAVQQPGSAPGAGRRNHSNLVGRIDELDVLDRLFDEVAGGRALGALVGGDAGIGKSRLVEEFCDRIRLREGVVATGLCVPAHSGLPYAPVVGILRDLERQLGRPSRTARLLRGLGIDLDVVDLAEPNSLAAQSAELTPPAGPFAKLALFETLLSELTVIAEKSAVLIVFEDLHWADSASSELFDYLVRNLGDARVLALGTYRDEEFVPDHPLASWLTELARHPRVSQLTVRPLDRAELVVLIENTLGERPAPPLVESVWTRSLGNPFFAEQLLAEGDPAALSTALRAVIASRVRKLPKHAQTLLGVMAVAGALVDHRLLEAIAGMEGDALDEGLNLALEQKIIVVDDSGTGYQFRHALLREAVYDALLASRRSRLHRKVATALAADPTLGSRSVSHGVAELASHWWAAGDLAAALEPSVQAANAAIAALAFPEANTFLEQALLAARQFPQTLAATDLTMALLLEKAADVAYLGGANARAVELAHAALAEVDRRTDPAAAARCLTLLGRNLWGLGDSASAFAAYREAIALLPGDTPSVELARLLAEEARGHMLMSQFTAGHDRALDAIAMARAAGSREVEGHALNTMGCCRGGLGFYDEAIGLIQQSLEIAEEAANPEDMNRAFGNLSAMLLDTNRLEETAALMFDSAAIGEQLWGARLNGAAGNGVDALVRLGRYREAEQVLALLGTQALGVCAPSPWTLPSPMMIRRGQFDTAHQLITTAMEMTSRLGDVQQAAGALGLAGELELERGHPDSALFYLEQALALGSRSEDEVLLPELCMWAMRAVADQWESGRAEQSEGELARHLRRSSELVAPLEGIVALREARKAPLIPRFIAAHAQTIAEHSRLRRSEPALWDAAARRWEAAHELYPQAYCRWREAEATLDGGGRSRATASLQEAWHLARELGAEPLLKRIVSLAQRGRIELRDAPAEAVATPLQTGARLGLTAREIEVLSRLAAGCSDREIAETLFISKKTVSVHVSNVLRKLDVSGRVEAGKIGQAHGL